MNPWQLLETGKFQESLDSFQGEVAAALDPEQKAWALANQAYPLVKLGRFDEARSCVKGSWEHTKDSHFLHQMAFVEREAGNYSLALSFIEEERAQITQDNFHRLTVNSYEQGKLRQLLGKIEESRIWAELCKTESQKCDDNIAKACAFRLLGDQYYLENNNLKAQVLFAHAQWFFQKENDSLGTSELVEKQVEAAMEHETGKVHFRIPNLTDSAIQKELIANRADSYFTSFGTDSEFWKDDSDGTKYLGWLKEKLQKFPASLVCLYQNDQIIGQLEFGLFADDPSVGYVNLYYLKPNFRGKGLSALLATYTEAHFRELQIQKLRLSVSPSNATALRFYKKNKWVDLGERPNFPSVRYMEKTL